MSVRRRPTARSMRPMSRDDVTMFVPSAITTISGQRAAAAALAQDREPLGRVARAARVDLEALARQHAGPRRASPSRRSRAGRCRPARRWRLCGARSRSPGPAPPRRRRARARSTTRAIASGGRRHFSYRPRVVAWKKRINDALAKTTGYHLERAPRSERRRRGGRRPRRGLRKGDRLVQRARLRHVHAALRLDAPARAAEQPLEDPRAARDPPALHLGATSTASGPSAR